MLGATMAKRIAEGRMESGQEKMVMPALLTMSSHMQDGPRFILEYSLISPRFVSLIQYCAESYYGLIPLQNVRGSYGYTVPAESRSI